MNNPKPMRVLDRLHAVNPYDGFIPPADADDAAFKLGHGTLGGDSPLFRLLVERVRPGLIVDVGSLLGDSAITMARAVQDLGLDCQIVCVDSWQGLDVFWDPHGNPNGHDLLRLKNGWPQLYYYFLANVVKFGMQNIIVPLPLPCDMGAGVLQRLSISADLIYIDASHDESAVQRDIAKYLPLLNEGGVIFGDDLWQEYKIVANAVRSHFGNDYWTYPWIDPNSYKYPMRFWVHGCEVLHV